MKDYEKFILCEVNPSKDEITEILLNRILEGRNDLMSSMYCSIFNQEPMETAWHNIDKHKELLEKIEKYLNI